MSSPQTAREAPRSTAPDPRTANRGRSAPRTPTWQNELAVHPEKYKLEQSTAQSVAIVLKIALDRSGDVVSAEVKKSSGDAPSTVPRST